MSRIENPPRFSPDSAVTDLGQDLEPKSRKAAELVWKKYAVLDNLPSRQQIEHEVAKMPGSGRPLAEPSSAVQTLAESLLVIK